MDRAAHNATHRTEDRGEDMLPPRMLDTSRVRSLLSNQRLNASPTLPVLCHPAGSARSASVQKSTSQSGQQTRACPAPTHDISHLTSLAHRDPCTERRADHTMCTLGRSSPFDGRMDTASDGMHRWPASVAGCRTDQQRFATHVQRQATSSNVEHRAAPACEVRASALASA